MLKQGWVVTAAGRDVPPPISILGEDEAGKVIWRSMDITRQEEVAATVEHACADVVIHLAGISHVPDAANDPGYAYEVNAVGTVRLLAELRHQRATGASDPSVIIVGSAEQYGRHELNEMPLHEDVTQRPLTLYAASKVAQEIAAQQAWRSDGMRIICTRSFNHSGIGHASHFLLPGLVRRALELPRAGGTLAIGNGDVVRDFLHVSDVADAYLALASRGATGEAYNVCSGEGTSVKALAAVVLERAGISAAISSHSSLTRSIDVPVLVGSNQKLRRATGWSPVRTRNDIIDDLIHAASR